MGGMYNCWMLNCWCITWPVGFKRLKLFFILNLLGSGMTSAKKSPSTSYKIYSCLSCSAWTVHQRCSFWVSKHHSTCILRGKQCNLRTWRHYNLLKQWEPLHQWKHHIPYDLSVQQSSVRNPNLPIKLHVVGIFSGSEEVQQYKYSNILFIRFTQGSKT